MNTRSVMLATFAVTVSCAATLTASSNSQEASLDVKLPDNSCYITCPAGTTWRAQPVGGGGVTCVVGYTPLCQCQDETRPIAGCESRKQRER